MNRKIWTNYTLKVLNYAVSSQYLQSNILNRASLTFSNTLSLKIMPKGALKRSFLKFSMKKHNI